MSNRLISFPFEVEKAAQALLWLLHRNNGSMSKMKAMKLFFYADRMHLAKYGRPILGGHYYALPHGPVCSELLDYINGTEAGLRDLPITFRGHTLIADGIGSTDWLSESDREVLDCIYGQYGQMDASRLRKLTHQLKAYELHKPHEGGREPLPYEDFFEDLDESDRRMLAVIKDEQEAWADFN